ncbi:MAG TPA: polysaccharide deacetylase family protein [Xanthobacteraceae bacterium]|nr:polysaccharide deacetylase family protein [Xanthobacteraceae bacterium]
MRRSFAYSVLVSASMLIAPASWAQVPAVQAPTAQPKATTPPPAPPPVAAKCANPDAIPMSRTVEIDTTGAPGFGFEHFKNHDFLKQGEVVLTFDDGPWVTTPKVLKALADNCVKATFFIIGKHATYHPNILKDVEAAGHTIGAHTWSHANLEKKTFDQSKEEIEKGIAAIQWALDGRESAPFFRFPALKHPPEVVKYLASRNIAMFSTDFDSFDFKMRKPEQVIKSVMDKLEKHGKGIILMHDFQHATADALPELLKQMKEKGYKVVHMKPKFMIKSLPEYDELLKKENKMPAANTAPTDSIVKTVN